MDGAYLHQEDEDDQWIDMPMQGDFRGDQDCDKCRRNSASSPHAVKHRDYSSTIFALAVKSLSVNGDVIRSPSKSGENIHDKIEPRIMKLNQDSNREIGKCRTKNEDLINA